MKTIVIGCDNSAVELKKHIISMLELKGISYEDIGVNSEQDEKIYPLVAKELVQKIIESNYSKEGILLCGTGIGMAIAANKFPGIYAAVCHDSYSAERARLSNNTNVLTMGSKVVGPELAKRIAKEWLELEFKPSSSTSKVHKIEEFEKENLKLFRE
jgi:ribose 5-phosphate isomerase B